MWAHRKQRSTKQFASVLAAAAAVLAAACSDVAGPTEIVPVARVDVIAPAPAVAVGATIKLRAEPRDPQGALLRDRTVAWSSSNESVATVSQAGDVLARSAGTVIITARAEGKSGSTTLSVDTGPGSAPGPAPSTFTLSIGRAPEFTADPDRTEQLYANLSRRENDTHHIVAIFPHSPAGHEITWTSSDPRVVRVSATGEIATGWAGIATITAVSGAAQAEVRVHVRSVVRGVRVTSDTPGSIAGGTLQLTAEANPANGSTRPRQVTWTSGNARVASVDANGRVTAHSPGTAVISATIEGVVGRYLVTVDGAAGRLLQTAGGEAPGVARFQMEETDAAGTVRLRSVRITSGYLVASSDWYRLRLDLRIEDVAGRLVRTEEYVDEGRIVPHWLSGRPMWQSATRQTGVFPELEQDQHGFPTGRLRVSYRLPEIMPIEFVFAAP